jgi:hypothetical protein
MVLPGQGPVGLTARLFESLCTAMASIASTGVALANRLRTEGTDHLLEAARAAGARRIIAQS